MAEVLGAVLAGGRGTRLGQPKATARLAGRPLIEYSLDALEAAGIEPVVIAKAHTPVPPCRAPVWEEPDEPAHPLAGIVTALQQADGRAVLACACDLPFVTAAFARFVAGREAALVVPRTGSRLHPLFARYTEALLPALREALARQAPLQRTVSALAPIVLGETELRRLGDPDVLLFNVNTPADLERAEALLSASGGGPAERSGRPGPTAAT